LALNFSWRRRGLRVFSKAGGRGAREVLWEVLAKLSEKRGRTRRPEEAWGVGEIESSMLAYLPLLA